MPGTSRLFEGLCLRHSGRIVLVARKLFVDEEQARFLGGVEFRMIGVGPVQDMEGVRGCRRVWLDGRRYFARDGDATSQGTA